MRTRSGVLAALPAVAALLPVLLASACSSATAAGGQAGTSTIAAIGAENEYANVIQQIGGKYVQVSAIMSNPNTDPHTFEASPAVAREVSAAQLVVQNGVGYDTFMSTIESASPNSDRKVIDVQQLLGLPDSTPNPHLWYKPTTMPAVANAIAADLAQLDPAHASYFKANAAAWAGWISARSLAMAAATFGMVAGLYHRCGFGVLSGRPSNCCTSMTLRPSLGTAFSMSVAQVS